jgi:hypothetical protein
VAAEFENGAAMAAPSHARDLAPPQPKGVSPGSGAAPIVVRLVWRAAREGGRGALNSGGAEPVDDAGSGGSPVSSTWTGDPTTVACP